MLEGAKQEGTSDGAYSRNQPSGFEDDQERHGRLVPGPPATGKPNSDVPAVMRTCAVLPRRCVTQMIGVFTRPVKAIGHRRISAIRIMTPFSRVAHPRHPHRPV